MYVKNVAEVDGLNKFFCDQLVAHYLVYNLHLPLFGMWEGKYVFIKTENFNKLWKTIPLHIKVRYETQ